MMQNVFMKKIVVAMAATMLSTAAFADKAMVEKKVKQLVPNVTNVDITETPVKGLYQVLVPGQVVYMSGDGNYLLNGALIDINTRQNLTETAMNKVRKAQLDKMDVAGMIVYPAKGKTKSSITVFSDIDCPYCKKLHKEIPALNEAGIEVRYTGYPRAGVGSPSYKKAVSAWCAKDPAKAMDDAMMGMPLDPKDCKNDVIEHMQAAQAIGVNGTPNIIFENGQMIPGYAPARELIPKILNAK